MSLGQTAKELLAKMMDSLKCFGKERASEGLPTKDGDKPAEGVSPSTEAQADLLARHAPQRPGAVSGAPEGSRDQWARLKKSAKDLGPPESNLEHWNTGKETLLSRTTFDAATTDVSNGRARKRPTVVTQARITSNRLQALQARMEKPKNEIDAAEQEEDRGPGFGH